MKKFRLLTALTATFLMNLWTVSCIDNLSDGEDLPNPYNFSYLYGKTILSDGTAIDSVNTTFLFKKMITGIDGSYRYKLNSRGDFDV